MGEHIETIGRNSDEDFKEGARFLEANGWLPVPDVTPRFIKPDIIQRIPVKPETGVLYYAPPGVAKTLTLNPASEEFTTLVGIHHILLLKEEVTYWWSKYPAGYLLPVWRYEV